MECQNLFSSKKYFSMLSAEYFTNSPKCSREVICLTCNPCLLTAMLYVYLTLEELITTTTDDTQILCIIFQRK